MTRRTFVWIQGLAAVAINLLPRPGFSASWTYEKTEGQTLSFTESASGKTQKLKVSIKNPQYHGLLAHQPSGQTYVIYSGQACDHCGDQQAVFMTRIDGSGAPFQFVYPGQIRDPSRGLVYESRAFFGKCLPRSAPAYVSHQAEVIDRRRGLQRSVLIAEPGELKVEDRLMESHLPSPRTTLDLVKKKECFEIPGKARSVLRKNLGPGLPRDVLDDEDDEEDSEEVKKTETPDVPDAPPEAKAENTHSAPQ